MALSAGVYWLAAAWGGAEATVFVLVPDVLLTFIALRYGLRRALLASVAALLGALAGGMAMYLWGLRDGAQALALLDGLPAISPAMIASVAAQLAELGTQALFLGPLSGTPYKIYAAQAAAADIALPAFLLVSIPARMIRFVLAVLIAAGIARGLERFTSARARMAVLALFWIAFYAGYFAIMPN